MNPAAPLAHIRTLAGEIRRATLELRSATELGRWADVEGWRRYRRLQISRLRRAFVAQYAPGWSHATRRRLERMAARNIASLCA